MSKKGTLTRLFLSAITVAVVVVLSYLLMPDEKPRWYSGTKGYQDALELSAEQNRAILLYFRYKNCFLCDQFEETLLNDPLVTVKLKEFIQVKIFISSQDENSAFIEQLDIKKPPALFVQASPSHKPVSTHLVMEMEQIWVAKPSYLRGNFMHLSSVTLPIAIKSALVESKNRAVSSSEK